MKNANMFQIKTTTLIMDESSCVTSAAFTQMVRQQMRRLRNMRIDRGDRVVIYGPKSAAQCALFLAAFDIGAIIVPLYAGLKSAQLSHIFADCRPKAAFLGTYLFSQVQGQNFANDVQLELVSVEADPQPIHLETNAPVSMHSDAAIIYTSGSTGAPKGVVFSRINLLLAARSVAQYTNLSSDDCVLCVLPFSFDAGLVSLLSAIAAGANVVLADFIQPNHLASLCNRWNVTAITAVPGLWKKIAGTDWHAASQSIAKLCNTGGHLNSSLLKQLQNTFPKADIYPMYGFTEAFRCTFLPPARVKSKPLSVGRSIPYSSFAIISEHGKLCGPNEVGELVQFGPLVTSGYWNKGQENRHKFRPVHPSVLKDLMSAAGALYRFDPSHFGKAAWSGDLAQIDEDGDLHFICRSDGIMKVNGFRVSPTELEEACLRAGCTAAFASTIQASSQTELSVAYAAEPPLSVSQLEQRLRVELPTYMMPKHFLQLVDVPLNDNGKFCRKSIFELVNESWKKSNAR